MVDVREDILARLLVVVAAIPNIRSSHRSNVDINEKQLPAVVVLDGDEETNDSTDFSMRPANRPTVVHLTPGLMIVDQGELVGSALSVLRSELIKRVLTDTELNEQIVKTGRFGNGAIRYLGCQTDLGWARELHGALAMQFLFKYALRPEQL
jgi:hypothetical protein